MKWDKRYNQNKKKTDFFFQQHENNSLDCFSSQTKLF